MTLVTTCIALLLQLHWVLSRLGPLNILISKRRGIEIVGLLDHLTLWGSESLSSYLRPRLKLWLSRMDHRSSSRSSNTRSKATAWLMLTHQLTLALHHSSTILLHKSLVHHSLEVLKISGLQSMGQSIIQAIQETFLLLFINVFFMRSITRQLSELGDILIHRQGPLFQILKLLLQLDNSLGNMLCMESSFEFWLVDTFHISIPPIICRTRKLVRG
jgi:hypothetical protein